MISKNKFIFALTMLVGTFIYIGLHCSAAAGQDNPEKGGSRELVECETLELDPTAHIIFPEISRCRCETYTEYQMFSIRGNVIHKEGASFFHKKKNGSESFTGYQTFQENNIKSLEYANPFLSEPDLKKMYDRLEYLFDEAKRKSSKPCLTWVRHQ